MTFWCWHKWTKWAKIGDVLYQGKVVGFSQERHCEKCGYVQSERTLQV